LNISCAGKSYKLFIPTGNSQFIAALFLPKGL